MPVGLGVRRANGVYLGTGADAPQPHALAVGADSGSAGHVGDGGQRLLLVAQVPPDSKVVLNIGVQRPQA